MTGSNRSRIAAERSRRTLNLLGAAANGDLIGGRCPIGPHCWGSGGRRFKSCRPDSEREPSGLDISPGQGAFRCPRAAGPNRRPGPSATLPGTSQGPTGCAQAHAGHDGSVARMRAETPPEPADSLTLDPSGMPRGRLPGIESTGSRASIPVRAEAYAVGLIYSSLLVRRHSGTR